MAYNYVTGLENLLKHTSRIMRQYTGWEKYGSDTQVVCLENL